MLKKEIHKQERNFGLFFSFFFICLAAYLIVFKKNYPTGLMSTLISAGFIFTGLFFPALLAPLNKAWMAMGHFLGRIVSPIVLGLIFFVLITPVALMGRSAGRDPLRLKARIAASYWIKREPPGPTPDSFKNQF